MAGTVLAIPAAARADDPDADTQAEQFQVLAALISDSNRKIANLNGEIDTANARLEALASAITDTQQKIDATQAEVDRLRGIVRARVAFIYRQAHGPKLAVVQIADVRDVVSGSKYAESATRVDTGTVDALTAAAAQLDLQRKALDAQRNDVDLQRQRLEQARDGLKALVSRQKKFLDDVGAVSLMGAPQLTAEEVTAWFLGTHRPFQLSAGTTMTDLVRMYYDEGKVVNIRPDVAFAQSIIETGSFGHATDNNYAGIGVCDSCDGKEPGFDTPRDGVRGQMQMLRAFADKKVTATDLVYPPSPVIWGAGPDAAPRSTRRATSVGHRRGTRWGPATGRRIPTTHRRCSAPISTSSPGSRARRANDEPHVSGGPTGCSFATAPAARAHDERRGARSGPTHRPRAAPERLRRLPNAGRATRR